MPALRKLPDDTTLRHLRAQGYKLKKIADEYGVTQAAVWKALERAGFTEKSETYQDIVPWDIDPKHRSTAVAQRLRAMQRQRQGKPLNDTELRLLEAWRELLKANGVVLDYHPEAPANDASRLGGFFYTPRLPEDEGIFRMPKKKKNGPAKAGRKKQVLEGDPEPETTAEAVSRLLTIPEAI